MVCRACAGVVKYGQRNGVFLKMPATAGAGPLEFNTPHGLAMDAQGNVYIADRGNNRVQVLDNELNFQDAVPERRHAVDGVRVTRSAFSNLFSSNSNAIGNFDNGEIYKMELDGKIVGRFGEGGKQMKQFGSGSRDRLPRPERDSRRELTKLARAEADAEGADELDEVNPKTQNPKLNSQGERGSSWELASWELGVIWFRRISSSPPHRIAHGRPRRAASRSRAIATPTGRPIASITPRRQEAR